MYQVLKKLINKEPVAIYNDTNDRDDSYVGFVKAVTKEEVLLYAIDVAGLSNGFMVMKIDDIFRVEEDTNYIKKIHKLYTLQDQKHEELICEKDTLTESLFHFAKTNNRVVNIDLFEEVRFFDACGLVEQTGDSVTINQYDIFGKRDGKNHVSTEDISIVRCCRFQDVALEKLIAANENALC